MLLNNIKPEPTDLELYFLETRFSNQKYDFELLKYLIQRDYRQEAASLLKNFIEIEGIVVYIHPRCS